MGLGAIESTEKTAIESLKAISDAVERYRRTYTRLPDSLANLAAPTRGAPSAEAAAMLDPDLVAGARSGYNFRYVLASNSTLGCPRNMRWLRRLRFTDVRASVRFYGWRRRDSRSGPARCSWKRSRSQSGVSLNADWHAATVVTTPRELTHSRAHSVFCCSFWRRTLTILIGASLHNARRASDRTRPLSHGGSKKRR